MQKLYFYPLQRRVHYKVTKRYDRQTDAIIRGHVTTGNMARARKLKGRRLSTPFINILREARRRREDDLPF